MNQALKPRQVAFVASILLLLALLVGYRYFTAPGNNTGPEATRELQGASVASLKIVLGPLAPPHLKVENPKELLTHPEHGNRIILLLSISSDTK